ncbi:MAG: polysaccharide export outer membrane protein [Oceanicoccus sp.]|jgi:polysaccharide export outer membrane protein
MYLGVRVLNNKAINTSMYSQLKQWFCCFFSLSKVFAIAMVALLVGCSSGVGNVAVPVDLPSYTESAYQIGVGDAIRVDVWGNDQLSVEVPVRPDGKISMSLIGDILAADTTAEQLADRIRGRLMEYLKNPQVAVIVVNPSSADFLARIRVTGAVNNPQSVPFRKGMTVLDLVLLAGGPNDFAVSNKSKLYRRVGGKVKIYPVYLEDILKSGKLESNYMLFPSDIVTVPERSF